MNTIPNATMNDAQQVFMAAVAHQIERMSKEELQALVAKVDVELQNENAALKKRVEQLEADKLKLLYEVACSKVTEKDFENFDPSKYTVPVEEMMSNARHRIMGS